MTAKARAPAKAMPKGVAMGAAPVKLETMAGVVDVWVTEVVMWGYLLVTEGAGSEDREGVASEDEETCEGATG